MFITLSYFLPVSERGKLWGCKGESVALLIEQEWSKRWVVSWVIAKLFVEWYGYM
jgi:hypothetical protein